MRRGEVHLADLGDPVGQEQALRRPVLIVSANPWLASNPPVVTVLPITRTYRGSASHVELEPGSSGLAATSYVKCEDIRAISPLRLEREMGQADLVDMTKINQILGRLLGL